MERQVLTEDEVVSALSRCADYLREYAGETREADNALRSAEWLTRAINEKLFVYLHRRDRTTRAEVERVVRRLQGSL